MLRSLLLMSIPAINSVTGIGEHPVDIKCPKITMIAGATLGIGIILTTYILKQYIPPEAIGPMLSIGSLLAMTCVYKLLAYRNVISPIKDASITASFNEDAICIITSSSLESHQIRLDMIQSAKKAIVFAASYSGGEALDILLEEIHKKLEEGVVVDFSVSSVYLTPENRKKFKTLEKHQNFNGIILDECIFYDDAILSLPKLVFYHVKGLSIDGGRVMLSGGSSSSGWVDRQKPRLWLYDGQESLSEKHHMGIAGFHDMDICWESPTKNPSQVGSQLDCQIRQMHCIARKRQSLTAPELWPTFKAPSSAETGVDIKLYPCAPENSHNAFHDALIEKIDAETKSITFDHMYFHPTDEIIRALSHAATRGVSIRILHNRAGSGSPTSHHLFVNASRRHIAKLFESTQNKEKISAYEYNRSHVTLHKKMILFENQHAVVIGSANMGSNSLRPKQADYEMNMIVTDQKLYDQTAVIIDNDIRESRTIENPANLTYRQRLLGYGQKILQPFL